MRPSRSAVIAVGVAVHQALGQGDQVTGLVFGDAQRGGQFEPQPTHHHIGHRSTRDLGIGEMCAADSVDAGELLSVVRRHHAVHVHHDLELVRHWPVERERVVVHESSVERMYDIGRSSPQV